MSKPLDNSGILKAVATILVFFAGLFWFQYCFNVVDLKYADGVCLVVYRTMEDVRCRSRVENWNSYNPEIEWTLVVRKSDGTIALEKHIIHAKFPYSIHPAPVSSPRIEGILSLKVRKKWTSSRS